MKIKKKPLGKSRTPELLRSLNAVLFFACILFSSMAVSQTYGNYDPFKQRQQALNSFFLMGIDIFYGNDTAFINGLSHNNSDNTISPEQKQQLENMTSEMFEALRGEYKSKRSNLEDFFGVKLPKKISSILIMPDNFKGARIQPYSAPGEKTQYRIDIGFIFLRDNFRACLINNLTRVILADRLEERKDTTVAIDTVVTENQIVRVLRESIRFLKQAPAKINAVDLLVGPQGEFIQAAETMISLGYMADAIEEIDKQFYGTVLFGLAHEIGHEVLGTVLPPPENERTADWFKNKEIQADMFATFLLTNSYMFTGVSFIYFNSGGLGSAYIASISKNSTRQFLGYGIYFGTTYELSYSGYLTDPEYPSPSVRLEECTKVFNAAYKLFYESVKDKADRIARRSTIYNTQPKMENEKFKWINRN